MVQASDVARLVRFLVSTSELMGLFVNSHAMGRDGDDDWAQGSGGDSVEGGGGGGWIWKQIFLEL